MTAALALVRHGRVANPGGLVYGRLPGFGLSPEGRAQARAAASHLASRRIAALVSSPLDRARQTAQAIAERGDCPIDLDARLVEVANADEGAPFVPDPSWRGPTDEITLLEPRPFPPALETNDEVLRRMCAAGADALDRADTGSTAVLVSHQVPLALLARHLGVTAAITPHVVEAEVIVLSFDGAAWTAETSEGRGGPVLLPRTADALGSFLRHEFPPPTRPGRLEPS